MPQWRVSVSMSAVLDEIEIALVSEPASPIQVLETLQGNAHHLLQAPARLAVDDQKSEIYLLEVSEDIPAFWIYFGGHSPHPHKKQRQRARRERESVSQNLLKRASIQTFRHLADHWYAALALLQVVRPFPIEAAEDAVA